MTDLELTKLCAKLAGWEHQGVRYGSHDPEVIVWNKENASSVTKYDPLHDDTQAMALVKKLLLSISACNGDIGDGQSVDFWEVSRFDTEIEQSTILNRAIVECVAKIQKARV